MKESTTDEAVIIEPERIDNFLEQIKSVSSSQDREKKCQWIDCRTQLNIFTCFVCEKCKREFCKFHIFVENHLCINYHLQTIQEQMLEESLHSNKKQSKIEQKKSSFFICCGGKKKRS